MKTRFLPLLLIGLFLLSACSTSSTTPGPGISSSQKSNAGYVMNDDQKKTLASLQQVDNYPLYTMTYYGGYDPAHLPQPLGMAPPTRPWACTLVASFGNAQHKVYGRNFDWDFSPAVLLFTRSPNGYASVSMVDITYLGFESNEVHSLNSSDKREQLLRTPMLPFDGMNEYGVTIGMAAVPDSPTPSDAQKEKAGSVRIIRYMLDHAKTTEEAIAVFQKYSIDFNGGPQIHYMIADRSGHAATIEVKDGTIQIVRNTLPWQVTTNFYLSGSSEATKSDDWRYNTASTWLNSTQGSGTPEEIMQLMSRVKQNHTQWSVVYDMSTGKVSVVMNRDYSKVYTFQMTMAQQ